MENLMHYVVVGGGISGVSCAQEIARLKPQSRVTILSEAETVAEAGSIFRVTDHLDEITVYERSTDKFHLDNPDINIIKCKVLRINYKTQIITSEDSNGDPLHIPYDRLCLCTGARPKLIANHPNVIGLRDQHSVEELLGRLRTARRVAVVGNGGIALELIHELTFCEVDWVVKSAYIGSTYFDASASAFIMPALHARAAGTNSTTQSESTCSNTITSHTATAEAGEGEVSGEGYALGPEWIAKSAAKAFLQEQRDSGNGENGSLQLHLEQEVEAISSDGGATWLPVADGETDTQDVPTTTAVSSDYPLYLCTTSGQVIGCDFVVSATGVQPNPLPAAEGEYSTESPKCTKDGYICVDTTMRTSVAHVFAAGDCCELPLSGMSNVESSQNHFFQLRLWSQAHWMGVYAAQNMCDCADNYGTEMKFELFTHITRFFGYKVVMLGRFNAQGLGQETEALTRTLEVTADGIKHHCTSSSSTTTTQQSTGSNIDGASRQNSSAVEIWVRVTPGREYVKLTVWRGKLVGALLVGNTELEEVCENLILSALDISEVGVGLLDPDIDIADYFD